MKILKTNRIFIVSQIDFTSFLFSIMNAIYSNADFQNVILTVLALVVLLVIGGCFYTFIRAIILFIFSHSKEENKKKEDVEKEKNIIKEELQRIVDKPSDYLGRSIMPQTIFQNVALKRPLENEIDNINKINHVYTKNVHSRKRNVRSSR